MIYPSIYYHVLYSRTIYVWGAKLQPIYYCALINLSVSCNTTVAIFLMYLATSQLTSFEMISPG